MVSPYPAPSRKSSLPAGLACAGLVLLVMAVSLFAFAQMGFDGASHGGLCDTASDISLGDCLLDVQARRNSIHDLMAIAGSLGLGGLTSLILAFCFSRTPGKAQH